MKALIEEYGFLIMEVLVSVSVAGIFVFLLSRFGMLAGHFAEMLIGG